MKKLQITLTVLALVVALPVSGTAQLAAPSARSFGLAGSYSARARGYEAPYWNPANLGLPGRPGWSVGIVGANASINNNSLDYGQITDLYGEYIDHATKSQILADIRRGNPDRMFQLGGEMGASALAFSIWRFGFGLSAVGTGDLQVSPDAAELILFGNVGEDGTGKDFNITGDGDGSVFSNLYLSYGQPFSFATLPGVEFSIGASVKYGIAHALVLVNDEGSTFTSNPLVLDADLQVLSSNGSDAGRIWAFDLGAAMDWSNWTFSLALQNAFANVNWNVEDFDLSLFEGHADLTEAVLTDTTIAYSDLTPELQQQVDETLANADPPKRLRMGAMYRFGQIWTVSADYMELLGGTLREQWDRSLSTGVQLSLISALPLRAGLATDFSQVALAGGLGIYAGPVHIDASYSTMTLAAGDGAIASLSVSVWPGAGY
ncbi:MAG: hypothetical protein AMS21_09455 [Gemmatimonas sp. SG8_38_2]|nr:MAG: hypothetical protein AMS21_09455 [Gemmatimonas sp. SG8_38_2]